jgi:hypothetical protein
MVLVVLVMLVRWMGMRRVMSISIFITPPSSKSKSESESEQRRTEAQFARSALESCCRP